jgi:transcriptional regulator
LKYPRKPIEQHKTYKILPAEYPKVFAMRKKGDTIEKIATKFNVGKQTIRFILNPELRAKHNEKTVNRARTRLKTDKDFKEKQTLAVNEYIKDREKNDPLYKKYHKEQIKNSLKKMREKKKKNKK